MNARSRAATLALAALLAFNANAQLNIDPGVVVKFEPDAGIVVHNRLIVGEDARFTSVRDDSQGGQTQIAPSTPAPGDWVGIRVDPGIYAEQVQLSGTRISFAGQNRGAGLDLQSNIALSVLEISQSSVGLRVNRNAQPILRDFSLLGNTVGVLSDSAIASIRNSELVGNTAFGAQNLTPLKLLDARANWWGAASGPLDPLDNPTGKGNRVSTGVDYGQFVSAAPLLDCRVSTPISSVFSATTIQVSLRCRNAVEFRLNESAQFPGTNYQPMAATGTLVISANDGLKTIYAQFRSASGATRVATTRISLQYFGAVVELTSPIDGLIVTDNAPVPVAASTRLLSGSPVAKVEFFVRGESIGIDNSEPYTANWDTTAYTNGFYSIQAFATTTTGVTSEASPRMVQIRRSGAPGDTVPPEISLPKFNGVALVNGAQIDATGFLSALIIDPGCTTVGGCISDVDVFLNEIKVQDDGNITNNLFRVPLSFEKVQNGALFLRIVAKDMVGNAGQLVRSLSLNLTVPPPPVITQPLANTEFRAPFVGVIGTASLGSRVQIYANNVPVGNPVLTRTDGKFNANVEVPGNGAMSLSADASNVLGTGARSAIVPIVLNIPPPQMQIVAPFPNAYVSGDTSLQVAVIDYNPTANVAFFINGVPVGVDTSPPFGANYATAGQADGVKVLRAALRHGTTVVLEATRNFNLRRAAPLPAPFVPPYVATTLSALPALSYGDTPVQVRGRMRLADSTDNVPAINAPATLVFRSGNFDRRVNVVTNSLGEFDYTLTPRSSDAGAFQVTAIHPQAKAFENATVTGVADFVISRLTTRPARLGVSAPRNFPQLVPITVSNSAGVEAINVRLVVRAEDQPGAVLPRGISMAVGSFVSIQPGQSATFQAQLLNTDGGGAPLPRSGNVIVTVLEQSSGSLKRATARLDYELFDANPRLVPTPASVFTGVRRGQVATELLKIENKGLVPATNLLVDLVAGPIGGLGNPLPSWISLISTTNVPSFAPGALAGLELRMAPPLNVSDGIYNVALRVRAANDPGGTIAISINVNQAGEGSVRFKAVNIYTGTLDSNSLPVPGLAAASITLTSEANPLLRVQGSTNALGEVVLGPVPPGRYSYSAQAASHSPATGRVLVRPGVTADERVFLDFNAVSFTWSVTPTTILDQYNILLSATYQTQVPAPVLILEPGTINIPQMAVGEFITGEFSLTNHGLLRADNVQIAYPSSTPYFNIQFSGEVPNELAPNQRVPIYYRVTLLQPLPGNNRGAEQAALQRWLNGNHDRPARAPEGVGCNLFRTEIVVTASFICVAGDLRLVSSKSSFAQAYGPSCNSNVTPFPVGGGSSGGGGWGGAGRGGGYQSTGPLCGPDCYTGCACSGGCGPGGGPPPSSPPPSCPGCYEPPKEPDPKPPCTQCPCP